MVVTFEKDIDSWLVILPNMFNSDVIIPTMSEASKPPRTSYTYLTTKMDCIQLTSKLRDPLFIKPILITDDECDVNVQDIHTNPLLVQNVLGDPYSDSSIYSRGGDGIVIKRTSQYIQSRMTNGTTNILLRVLFVTSLQNAFVVHEKKATIDLVETNPYEGATLTLQHECARRGFISPVFATLDLATLQNIEYCVWVCRVGYIRVPWASPPPERISSNSLNPNTTSFCQPISPDFSAVVFELEFSTSIASPVITQLPERVYQELNDLSRSIEEDLQGKELTEVLTALTVLNGKYSDVRFNTLINEASSRQENTQSTIKITEHRPIRRLLTSHGMLTVRGIIFTSNVRMIPSRLEESTKESVRRVTEQRPTNAILESLTYVMISTLHHSTAITETNDDTIRNIILISGSLLFVIIAIVSIYLAKKLNQKPKHRDLSYPLMESR